VFAHSQILFVPECAFSRVAQTPLARDLADPQGNCFEQGFLPVLDAKLGK
jgi:hypothetical protein